MVNAMQHADFAATRPRVYHLTARSNMDRIRAAGSLIPAAEHFRAAGREDLVRSRRAQAVALTPGVSIRDQAPLYEGNCGLADGFTFADLIALLNEHVFFWPGTAEGPIRPGRNHIGRYAGSEDVVVLSLPTLALLQANAAVPARCCRYNSGSPRCNRGRRSPRHAGLFVPMSEWEGTPGDVVELVFRGRVVLPFDDVTITRGGWA